MTTATMQQVTRHEDASGIYYTVMAESDPTGEGYYTVRFNKIGFPSDNCKAGRQGQGCKHKLAAVQAEAAYQAQQHENSSVKRSGLKAYDRQAFSLLKVPTTGQKERSTMTAKKLTSINVQAGDIPETDQEVEKILAKKAARKPRATKENKLTLEQLQDEAGKEFTSTEEVEKFIAEKTAAKKPVARAKKLSLSDAQQAASGTLPQQQDIMGDVAKKSAKTKKVAAAKAKHAATVTVGGHARVTEDVAKAVLENVNNGVAAEEIAKMHNITVRRVKSIVAGRTWSGTTGVQKKGN